eukprot:1189744-Prorocentrum_minimum.AAC.5
MTGGGASVTALYVCGGADPTHPLPALAVARNPRPLTWVVRPPSCPNGFYDTELCPVFVLFPGCGHTFLRPSEPGACVARVL